MEKKDTENLLYRNRFMALLFLCLPLLNKYCSFTLPPALNVTLQFLSQRKLKVPLTPPEKEKAKGLTNTSPYQPFFFFFLRVCLQSWWLSEVLCHCAAVLRQDSVGLSGPKHPVKGVEEQIKQFQPAAGKHVSRLGNTGALASLAHSLAPHYYGFSL